MLMLYLIATSVYVCVCVCVCRFHKEQESLFSSGSGFQNYRGLLNDCILLLVGRVVSVCVGRGGGGKCVVDMVVDNGLG